MPDYLYIVEQSSSRNLFAFSSLNDINLELGFYQIIVNIIVKIFDILIVDYNFSSNV